MSESSSDPSASPPGDNAQTEGDDRAVRRDRIPRPTVRRLSLYLRELEGSMDGNGTVSSRQLATALGLTDAQVRKDLAYFGQFGQPGIGYRHEDLAHALRRILGTDRPRATAVIGAGNLGRAVTCYGRLDGKGFNVVEVFDLDEAVVGTTVGGLVVRSMTELAAAIDDSGVEIAMLAVPGAAAGDVADELVKAGIRGILNFAPVRLPVPDDVAVVSVDLTVALEQLAYKMALGIEGDEQHAAD